MAQVSSWDCSHLINQKCDLLKKECSPGEKGCVLYGKAKFANEETASNEAYDRRAKDVKDEVDLTK
ncbi:MAG: hypothetical protein LBQ18_08665 [Campylobacteraceae bacterium]|jgi:hypothetical protein|nr:hypothetical protein [Campylobacteraceae bacterium]